ncbi:bifunctional ornithine acetyltransferase/N-acetylglutamate synthase [Paramaledivibacter caminithermalis]|uniref:Arginine biosynthesis bifunctional protein ArgJ n=1 Tax=Paramaledivibacter caminithermalis (strain DSM 15212 / CIP 107654 / DViRD3) TaxID=1121301 RepID=A0A1M6SN37_PARC5|nr:bifunctional ornithine acetyltransferase/N-acetylglutamate synthase [Paramaledivibacter caminithermalis]SHK46123.1 glutamate N-acetyltransferase [Paramaledivibacter caminithermalis DSM 15212]
MKKYYEFIPVSGFKAAGVYCGIKKDKSKKDLSVIYSETKAVSAATFTTNKVKAAPVQINMKNINNDNTQAIVVNSGNANACTGEKGFDDALNMISTLADELNLSPDEVLVASTGIIGVPMPMEKIIPGIKEAASTLSPIGFEDASKGILTTDSSTKTVSVEFTIDDKSVVISGMAKGSGMIHPNMATMLGFILTDASITKKMLQKALSDSVSDSFNMISVDGDTSTNDMVIMLANGKSNNKIINMDNGIYNKFKAALDIVNVELAKMIAKDGEGATKLIEVNLSGGKSKEDAKLCAKSIITSNLVKSAFFGSDANWGRVLCSMGYSGGDFIPEDVELFFESKKGKIQLVKNGVGLSLDEKLAKEILLEDYIKIIVDLKNGEYSAKAWGCDLSYDYVKINASYRS